MRADLSCQTAALRRAAARTDAGNEEGARPAGARSLAIRSAVEAQPWTLPVIGQVWPSQLEALSQLAFSVHVPLFSQHSVFGAVASSLLVTAFFWVEQAQTRHSPRARNTFFMI